MCAFVRVGVCVCVLMFLDISLPAITDSQVGYYSCYELHIKLSLTLSLSPLISHSLSTPNEF